MEPGQEGYPNYRKPNPAAGGALISRSHPAYSQMSLESQKTLPFRKCGELCCYLCIYIWVNLFVVNSSPNRFSWAAAWYRLQYWTGSTFAVIRFIFPGNWSACIAWQTVAITLIAHLLLWSRMHQTMSCLDFYFLQSICWLELGWIREDACAYLRDHSSTLLHGIGQGPGNFSEEEWRFSQKMSYKLTWPVTCDTGL